MAKSNQFSIYLLKKEFTHFNSLKDDHGLEISSDASNLPIDSILYLSNKPLTEPWWKNYFGINRKLIQSANGALVFIPIHNWWFVLSFGIGHNKLKSESYEYDFGLRVTLNCVDPNKLKSTDTNKPSTTIRQKTQISNNADLTFFDFDYDSTILNGLTGKVKEKYKYLFENAAGTNSFKCRTLLLPKELQILLETLLKLYESENFIELFPGIRNICPVKDPIILKKLDENLLANFKEKNDRLYLTVPETVDYQDISLIKFTGQGKKKVYSDVNKKNPDYREEKIHYYGEDETHDYGGDKIYFDDGEEIYDDVYIYYYYTYIKNQGLLLDDVTINDLKKHKLEQIDKNGYSKQSYKVYKCLCYDTKLDKKDKTYYLNMGKWCIVKDDYILQTKKYIDSHYHDIDLPDYNHLNEAEYNTDVPKISTTPYLCLDKTNIGLRVEPCDLYSSKNKVAAFIHVKRFHNASVLGHLFNQGTLSALHLRKNASALPLLKTRIDTASNGKYNFYVPEINDNFKVVFAIITHKDKTKKSKNINYSYQYNMMRAFQNLEAWGHEVSYQFIKDLKELKKRQNNKLKKNKTKP